MIERSEITMSTVVPRRPGAEAIIGLAEGEQTRSGALGPVVGR
jgi:hypothetical protein